MTTETLLQGFSWKEIFDADVERYIKENLKWSDEVTDYQKTLVIGNIRGFAGYVKECIADLPEKTISSTRAERDGEIREKADEISLKSHMRWLEKAKTAVVNGNKLTVLPYGYLQTAIKESILELLESKYSIKHDEIVGYVVRENKNGKNMILGTFSTQEKADEYIFSLLSPKEESNVEEKVIEKEV